MVLHSSGQTEKSTCCYLNFSAHHTLFVRHSAKWEWGMAIGSAKLFLSALELDVVLSVGIDQYFSTYSVKNSYKKINLYKLLDVFLSCLWNSDWEFQKAERILQYKS